MSEFLSVYMTAPSMEAAEKMAQILVEEKLAACVNIFPQVLSVYKWEGKTETSRESVLIAKTKASVFDALKAKVIEMHPYECPCLVGLPIEAGSEGYLDWLRKNV